MRVTKCQSHIDGQPPCSLSLLLAAAEQAQVPMPMASLIHDRFVAALAQGLADADWAGIARISYQEVELREAA